MFEYTLFRNIFTDYRPMKKSILLFYLLIISYISSFAQSILVKGKVADRKNNIELSGVTVKVGEYATRTDKDGYFELTAPLPKLKENGITFSYVGYLTMRLIYETGRFYNVQLTEKNTELREVLIAPGDDIIKKAISKIPENYAEKPIAIKGLLRIQKWRNQSQYFKSDAIISAYIPPYTSNEETSVKVLANQLDTVFDNSLKYIRNVQSYNLVQFADLAHNKNVLKKLLSKRKFEYRLVGKQLYNKHKVFVINTFLADTSKKFDKLEATLYIDTASYAFVAANLAYYNIPRNGPFIGKKELVHGVSYDKIGNKWYLAEAHVKSTAVYKNEEPKSVLNFIRTELDSINVQKFAYKDIVQNGDDIFLIDKLPNPEDLAKNKMLFEAAENDGKIELIPQQKLDTIRKNSSTANLNYKRTFGRKVYDYLRGDNSRINYGFLKLPFDVSSTLYGVPASINYGLGIGANYRVYKNLFFGFESNPNFFNKKKIKLGTLGFNLSHEFILNKNHRSITLVPHAGYQLLTINYEKKEQNYSTINYGLRAAYELTRRKALFISSNFTPNLTTYTINTLSVKQIGYAIGFGLVIKR